MRRDGGICLSDLPANFLNWSKSECESARKRLTEPEDGTIEIVQLGKSLRKPRWLSHLIFAKKVRTWVMKNAG